MLEFAEWQLNKLTEKCTDEDSKIMLKRISLLRNS